MNEIPPGVILILGPLLAILLPDRARRVAWVALPLLSWLQLTLAFAPGAVTTWEAFGLTWVPIRVDRLSLAFGHVFHLAATLSAIYAWDRRDSLSAAMAAAYAGSAIAAVFAGDLLSLFVFWELTAVTSVFLVWQGRTAGSYRAGMRYLIVQVGSGVLLLSGAVFRLQQTGDLAFGAVDQVGVFVSAFPQAAAWLIVLAFGIKAAFPLLHAWLPDAYPEASPSGTVYLSAFTTKLAVYALLRGFAGWEPLLAIGCVMALVPLVYAWLEDDVRRSLAYCLNNQLGFMVVAAGVGGELAVNGATAHAVAHILYKGLLFMATGAVLSRTGTARASQLGGLARAMPWTFAAYLVGAAAISMPLFSGFVTKSLSLSAVAQAHHQAAWVSLLVATAGVFFVCGLRIPYDVFLGDPQSNRVGGEAAWSMRLAMILASACCLLIGLAPGWLYARLPYAVDYHAYTVPHVVEQLQILALAGLVFAALLRFGVYRRSTPGVLLDVDWLYRRLLPRTVQTVQRSWQPWKLWLDQRRAVATGFLWDQLTAWLSDDGRRGRFAATGQMAMWAALMLVVYLLLYYR